MESHRATDAILSPSDDGSFSLVAGGPIYRVASALAPPFRPYNTVVMAAIMTAVVSWLPLLILSAASGRPLLVSGQPTVLTDVTVWSRFLIAAPLLVLAERPCSALLAALLHQLVASGAIPPNQVDAFTDILARAARRRDSIIVEVLLIVAALASARVTEANMLSTGTQLLGAPAADVVHTPLGNWFFWVSIPLLHLLIFRWFWRLVILTGILWRVTRLDLQIIPTHPDHFGGLGFLRFVPSAFNLVALGLGTAFAGALYRAVHLGQVDLNGLRVIVPVFVLVIVLIFTAPVLVLGLPLTRAKFRGEVAYGRLARSLTAALQRKWMGSDPPTMDVGLDANDFSAAVDLTQLSAGLNEMHLVPVRLFQLIPLVAAAGIPSLFVVATVVPVAELLNKIASLLF